MKDSYLYAIVSQTFPEPSCNKNKCSFSSFPDPCLLKIDKVLVTKSQNLPLWNLKNYLFMYQPRFTAKERLIPCTSC